MIVITGATGLLGREIVEELLTRHPADHIGVSVRDPNKADDLGKRGVRVRQADYSDPASLVHSFEGATQVLIVSANSIGEEKVRGHRNAIEAAREAGARRVLYTSHMGANPSSPFPPMPDHAATEAILRESGMAYTSLRNGFYASSGIMHLRAALTTGEVAAPQDGPVSWTAHADLAEAAAIILTDEGRFDGPTPALTASEALDLDDMVSITSQILGRPIRRVTISDDEYRASLTSHSWPGAADMLMGLFTASRNKEFAATDPTLPALLGRPTTPFRTVIESSLSAQN
ncbi:SDR family oxidoreductase [Sphaerisporangium sp. NPDC051017]|uniref:SDR family oxidoreductase n=1 Tax=Sphaerisporangium sp. NPDC051017 TaxID=3154636 RepID=UPI00343B81D2